MTAGEPLTGSPVPPAAFADDLREGEVDVDRFVIVVEEDQVVRDGNDVADARIVVEDLKGFDASTGAMQV